MIDAGISCRETERRMTRLGLDMALVKAIFVSHEHIDHITGLPALSKKYQLPVYITEHTLRESNVPVQEHLVKSFHEEEPITIGSLSVTAFKKFHDACDPHSFIVTDDTVTIGIFTDIGIACSKLIRYFRKCHAAFLEANYCPDMLRNGNYPPHLQKRISSDTGHLSNIQALELFTRYKSKRLTHLILSHLSQNNNRMELVNQLFSEKAGDVNIVVASRHRETALYSVEAAGNEPEEEADIPVVALTKPLQLSLF